MTPCPASDYFDTVFDLRYTRVPGEYSVSQTIFESENGLDKIWNDRYSIDETKASLVRQTRKDGKAFTPYQRPTIGWKMACELDPSKPSRQEIFDQILNKKFKSQEPDLGKKYQNIVIAILTISLLSCIYIVLLTCLSGWRKGKHEDDGFWEVYDTYKWSHIIITLLLAAVMFLNVPIIYEYAMVMKYALED